MHKFSLGEKKAYFQKKWLREHVAFLCVLACIAAGALILSIVWKSPLFIALSVLLALGLYVFARHKMMTSIEEKLFPPPKTK